MSQFVISGYSRFPVLKDEVKIRKALKEESYFSFSSKDLFLSWKFKRWAAEHLELANDFSRLIFKNVADTLLAARWPRLAGPSTEYGMFLATATGSEFAQLRFFQEVQKEDAAHLNPRLLPEIYFNGILNKLAQEFLFRGHSLTFWKQKEPAQLLLRQAVQALSYHQQKGCLVIVAEESSRNFGAGVLFLEKEHLARARGIVPRYFLNIEEKGRIKVLPRREP